MMALLSGTSNYISADGFAFEEDDDTPEEILNIDMSQKDDDLLKVEASEYIKAPFEIVSGDNRFKFAARLLMPEIFWGHNLNLLNSCNRTFNTPIDMIFYIRHTLDLIFEYQYGKKQYGYDILKIKATLRDRGIWGDFENIAPTTESDVKSLEVVFGTHRHFLPRYILWFRELWIESSIGEMLSLPFENPQFFTIGAFSFKLGRGIALGDAFAVTPDPILGFSAEAAVDQYAFGAKIWGDIVKDTVAYEVYGAILNNKADTFGNTAANIRGQEYGHKFCQARGFGIVNYIIANKFLITPELKSGELVIEPYWLFNSDPEQKVEFLGDATSNLGTLGLAAEFEYYKWEFGFDTAFNIGHQDVKGVDRNVTSFSLNQSFAQVTNTQVSLVINPGQPTQQKQSLPYNLVVQDADGNTINTQNVVNTSPQGQLQNGKTILSDVTLNNVMITGVDVPVPVSVVNSVGRFKNPYRNSYKGSMFVMDASYYILRRDLKVSCTFGFASGGPNPNRDITEPFSAAVNSDYFGFIGLQEIYPGARVKSVLFLSGIGRVPRPLDLPSQDVNDRFASTVSRFTNLLLFGTSMRYRPQNSRRQTDIMPNILLFWEENASRNFRTNPPFIFSTFLGTEINTIYEFLLMKDLKFWGKAAVFVPGKFYKQAKGIPLNRDQQKFLDNLDASGVIGSFVPTLGDDTTWGFNFGLEYIF